MSLPRPLPCLPTQSGMLGAVMENLVAFLACFQPLHRKKHSDCCSWHAFILAEIARDYLKPCFETGFAISSGKYLL